MIVCILFLSLIKLNDEHYAVKLMDYVSPFASRRAKWWFVYLLLSLIKVNSRHFAVKNSAWCTMYMLICLHRVTLLGGQEGKKSPPLLLKIDGLLFHPSLREGLNANSRTFFVTRQGKRRRLSLRKNVTFFFTKPTCPPRKPAFGRLSRRAALEKCFKCNLVFPKLLRLKKG